MINNPIQTPPPGGQTPPAGDPPGQTPTNTQPPGQTPGSQQQTPPPSNRMSLEDLPQYAQDMIHALRNEAKELRKGRDAELAAKQAAEEARLREQGQFKELADKHEARVKELEPIADRYKKLTELVNEQIKAGIKDWPVEAKTFDPGPSADIVERYAWFEKAQPLAAKLATQAAGYAPGNTPSPKPAGSAAAGQAAVEELKQRLKTTGRYGL
jgi:hypothetical protein